MEQADQREQQTASGKLRDGSPLGDLHPLPEADEIWGQRGVNGGVFGPFPPYQKTLHALHKPQQSQPAFQSLQGVKVGLCMLEKLLTGL